jgi:hypothetical protein
MIERTNLSKGKDMKTKILSAMVAVSLAAGTAQPLRAQGVRKISRSAVRSGAIALAPDPAEPGGGGVYPQQTLEDLRGELLNLADSVQEFAALAPPELVDTSTLRQARGQIQQMSTQYLNALRKGIDPSKLHDRLLRARAVVADYSRARSETRPTPTKTAAGSVHPETAGFPNANGFCTSANGSDVNRLPTAVVLAADVVFFVADGVREAAQDACKETVVALGEGGNTSLACIVVDAVWIVAKAVDEGIHFCDDDLTGAVVDANYARLDHIHTDLAGVQGSVNNLDTHVTNVDNHISSEFVALDTHVTNEFAALDAHLTALLAAVANQVSNVQAAIDEANQRLLVLEAGEKQIMKLDLTPEGRRQVFPAILTCTGSNCPDVLTLCPVGVCSWNSAGPLP